MTRHKKPAHPLAQTFASGIRKLMFDLSGRVPSVPWARARPAGECTHGAKHLDGYRTRYSHVLTGAPSPIAMLGDRAARKARARRNAR